MNTTSDGRSLEGVRRALADHGRYVVRCVLVASLAYGLATLLRLEFPIWVLLGALVVSQETAAATVDQIWGFCIGTAAGVVTGLLVSIGGSAAGLPVILQIPIAVAPCAALAALWQKARVAMWSGPLVIVLAGPGPVTVQFALARAGEITLGAIVGGLLAVLFERLPRRRARPDA